MHYIKLITCFFFCIIVEYKEIDRNIQIPIDYAVLTQNDTTSYGGKLL